MTTKLSKLLLLAAFLAVPAIAQPRTFGKTVKPFRMDVRLQGLYFDNFYQTSDPERIREMSALGIELRGAYRRPATKTDYYGHLQYQRWSGESLAASYSGRIGASRESEQETFNVFLHHNQNRPSFEVGNTYARADTTIGEATYSYRVSPNWEPGIQAVLERQTYDDTPARNNDFGGAGVSIRYHGFGPNFTPRIGFLRGIRKVENVEENYREDNYFLEVSTERFSPFWLQVGVSSRGRIYSIVDPESYNFRREDAGPSLQFIAAVRTHPRVTWSLYYAHETADSNVTNADFDLNFAILTVTYGF
ncbi:MAG: hypothetical protein ACXW31_00680 [Thermoanaerobaculia bacterium]